MSQHDYVIDNQTFPNTRTDLNNALAAIATTNAGATAPSTTYAYQLWYDTTTDFIKMRNADNDAWITLFEFDQANDTVSLPATSIQPNPNLIINGAMQVAQRGTSSTTNGYGSVDRWQNSYGVGGTVTGSQESLTSSDAPYALGFRNYFRMTNTATTSGTGDYRQIIHRIEAQNISNSGWNYTSTSSYVTLSFWVRSSVAGKYGLYITADDASYQFSFTETLAANTWTKVTKTISGNSNLVFNNDDGSGLSIHFVAWLGTNFTDSTATMDSWVALDSTKYLPDDIANWAGTSDATLDITGVKLELGQTATDFIHEDIGTTLRKCQRYYFQDTKYVSAVVSGVAPTGTNYPVEMRAAPTISGGGAGFAEVVKTRLGLFYYQTTTDGQLLTFNSEL
jgi:hypothetical protein